MAVGVRQRSLQTLRSRPAILPVVNSSAVRIELLNP